MRDPYSNILRNDSASEKLFSRMTGKPPKAAQEQLDWFLGTVEVTYHVRLHLPLAELKAVLAYLDYPSGVVTPGPVKWSQWIRRWKKQETIRAQFHEKLKSSLFS